MAAIDIRAELLSGGNTILRQAIAYHDRAMDIFEELEPEDNSALAYSTVGEELDMGAWVVEEPIAPPQEQPPRHRERKASDRPTPLSLEDLRSLAGDDDPSRWIPIINRRLEEGPLTFAELLRLTPLAPVQVWMGLLLGGFELTPGEEFYGQDFLINLAQSPLAP